MGIWRRILLRRTRTGRSFFPSAQRFGGKDPRFTGILQPSPTGSYYNPARYANQGFSGQELNRIQRNLSNVYNQDLQFNRVANPRYQPEQDTGYGSEAAVGSGRASPATTQNYLNTYGFDVGGGNVGVYLPSGGFASVRRPTRTLGGGLTAGGNAPFAGEPTAPSPSGSPQTPTAPSYGSQVGFSMLSNVPSTSSVPTSVARPPETPAAPFTTSETIGRGLASANPLRALPPIGSALASFGRGAFGIGRDIYGGFTGNRTPQPPPSEMGAGAITVTNPLAANPWGNASWNTGLPRRYFDPNYNQ